MEFRVPEREFRNVFWGLGWLEGFRVGDRQGFLGLGFRASEPKSRTLNPINLKQYALLVSRLQPPIIHVRNLSYSPTY